MRQEAVPWRTERPARLVVCAILIGLAIGNLAWAMTDWKLTDMWVYWRAAEAWQATGNPYALPVGADATSVYRYAPWLAAVFIPLTQLPVLWVAVGWATVMTLASIFAVVPLYRMVGGLEGLAGALFFGSILFGFRGNIHPLLIWALVWGIYRRSGPAWIALAASLKAVPILYLLIYASRREWGKVGVGLGLTALLVAPMLAFERPALMTDPGPSNSLLSVSPWAWLLTASVSVLVAGWMAYRRSGWTWLAAGAAACLALPRAFVYDVTFLLPGANPLPAAGRAESASAPPARHTSSDPARQPTGP